MSGERNEPARSQACMGCPFSCRKRLSSGIGNESCCVDGYFYQVWDKKKHGSVTIESAKAGDAAQKYGANNFVLYKMLPYLAALNEKWQKAQTTDHKDSKEVEEAYQNRKKELQPK